MDPKILGHSFQGGGSVLHSLHDDGEVLLDLVPVPCHQGTGVGVGQSWEGGLVRGFGCPDHVAEELEREWERSVSC